MKNPVIVAILSGATVKLVIPSTAKLKSFG